MQNQYYIVVDGRQEGPMPKEALASHGLKSDSLVWRAGMAEWQRASELPELADMLGAQPQQRQMPPYTQQPPQDPYRNAFANDGHQQQPAADNSPVWYAMLNGNRVGPATPDALVANGLHNTTPVWREGMPDWMEAATQPELIAAMKRKGNPYINQPSAGQPYGATRQPYNAGRQYGMGQGYGSGQPYGQLPQGVTNWMPWAIAATIGGLFSCIGMILGIIAIVQANKANNAYRMGATMQGESANSSAKVLTIIAIALDVIGIAGSTFFLSNIGNMIANPMM